jgi:hypothetical protein
MEQRNNIVLIDLPNGRGIKECEKSGLQKSRDSDPIKFEPEEKKYTDF